MRHLFMLAAEGGSEVGMWAAIKENPTFLMMNVVVSAIVLTIIIERAYFQLDRYRVNSKEFFVQIKKLVVAGNVDRAIKLCDAGEDRQDQSASRVGRVQVHRQDANRNTALRQIVNNVE